MSLKGRGQGVDLGTSTLSLIRSIFFSFFGLEFPYDPLNLFPFLVFLSPRPHRIGAATPPPADVRAGLWVIITRLAIAPHHCIIVIASCTFRWTSLDSKPHCLPALSTLKSRVWAELALLRSGIDGPGLMYNDFMNPEALLIC